MQATKPIQVPIRVSIVEDNTSVRESLAILLGGASGFVCASTHESAEEALEELPRKKPDVILMDINLVNMSGIDCVRELRSRLPAVRILMHTAYDDREQIFDSLRAGANGYLLKRTPAVKLLEALTEAHHGYSPMSPEIASMVVNYFHQRGATEKMDHLTAREKEVLDHLAKGYRYKEIGEALGITFATVRTHIASIYEKLHVSSRTEAVVKYLKG